MGSSAFGGENVPVHVPYASFMATGNDDDNRTPFSVTVTKCGHWKIFVENMTILLLLMVKLLNTSVLVEL